MRFLRSNYLTNVLFCTILLALGFHATAITAQTAAVPPAKAAELAKWDDPKPWQAQNGPANTAWDNQYRSFIQTDADATSKGFPTHAKSAEAILADAKLSADNLARHKGWTLFIKSASEAYRPPAATADLKALYTTLVNLQFGDSTKPAPKPPPPPANGGGGATPFETDPRVTTERDVVYGRLDFQAQKMDVYMVHSAAPTPVLVEFHGGGWRTGGKNAFGAYSGNLISKVFDAGISVISVDFRKVPTYWMPAMTDDAARAIQFIRSRATQWNIDPNRIAIIGNSTGGHLAAWVALHDDLANAKSTDPVERQSSRVRGFVDLYGPMDLTRADPGAMDSAKTGTEDFAQDYLLACACSPDEYLTDSAARVRLRTASPLFEVSRDDPPGLIINQGPLTTSKDHPEISKVINDPFSWEHGALLADAMEDAGIKVVRYIGPMAGKDPVHDVPTILDFLKMVLK